MTTIAPILNNAGRVNFLVHIPTGSLVAQVLHDALANSVHQTHQKALTDFVASGMTRVLLNPSAMKRFHAALAQTSDREFASTTRDVAEMLEVDINALRENLTVTDMLGQTLRVGDTVAYAEVVTLGGSSAAMDPREDYRPQLEHGVITGFVGTTRELIVQPVSPQDAQPINLEPGYEVVKVPAPKVGHEATASAA